jgi:low temperature requirement protein LtrA
VDDARAGHGKEMADDDPVTRSDESQRPAPLIRPPELRVREERSASRLELFFDLAYVLVIAELAASFGTRPDWPGAVTFGGLFTVTWWSWVTTTLYTNRFDTNDVIYRLAKLGGTAAVIGMAASAQEATTTRSVPFTVSYLLTRLLLLGLYARAYRHVPAARATVLIYLAGIGAGAAAWTVSLGVSGTARYALWATGILLEAAAPVLATRFGGGVPLHVEHLPERFGLFVMLVLGESIASVATGVHHMKWQAAPTWLAMIAFVAIAAAWWDYFDLGGAAGKLRLRTDGKDQESGVADAYIYGHLPLSLGLAAFAVGVEQCIMHPAAGLSPAGRWALHGGAALFLLGTAAIIAGTSGRWRAAWPWPTAALPAIAAIGLAEPAPVTAMSLNAAVLVLTVLAGVRQQRRGRLETTET